MAPTVKPHQRLNLWAAFDTAVAWLNGQGVYGTACIPWLNRLCFAIRSESYGGDICGNDGRNTSNSPGMTPARVALLRRSIDPQWLAANGLRIDRVGSNGRSTGFLQQISEDVGGGWGSMADTMRPGPSALMFMKRLQVTNNPVYSGYLVQEDGSRKWVEVRVTAEAADVLRVQQPLVSEALSLNYASDKVDDAKAVVGMYVADRPPLGGLASTGPRSFIAQLLNWD